MHFTSTCYKPHNTLLLFLLYSFNYPLNKWVKSQPIYPYICILSSLLSFVDMFLSAILFLPPQQLPLTLQLYHFIGYLAYIASDGSQQSFLSLFPHKQCLSSLAALPTFSWSSIVSSLVMACLGMVYFVLILHGWGSLSFLAFRNSLVIIPSVFVLLILEIQLYIWQTPWHGPQTTEALFICLGHFSFSSVWTDSLFHL